MKRQAAGIVFMAAALVMACASARSDDSRLSHSSFSPAASPTSSPAGAGGLPYLDSACGQKPGQVRQQQLLYNCADAGTVLTGLHWRSWTPRHADADVGRMTVRRPIGRPRVYRDARLEAFAPVRMTDGSRYFGCVLIRPGLNPANPDGDTWPVVPASDGVAQPAKKFALSRCRLPGTQLMSL